MLHTLHISTLLLDAVNMFAYCTANFISRPEQVWNQIPSIGSDKQTL